MSRTNESGVEYAPWEHPPTPIPIPGTTPPPVPYGLGAGATPWDTRKKKPFSPYSQMPPMQYASVVPSLVPYAGGLQTAVPWQTAPSPWTQTGMGRGSGPAGSGVRTPLPPPTLQTYNPYYAAGQAQQTAPSPWTQTGMGRGSGPAGSGVNFQPPGLHSESMSGQQPGRTLPKKVNPRTYRFAWGQAAPGGTFDPTTIPGMPKFLQDPNMPPQPTLAPPDAPDSGGPSWGGSGGGGGGLGGGGSRRQSWISSLYSLNVNR